MIPTLSNVEQWHVAALAEHMREDDRRELERFGYSSPTAAIEESLAKSIESVAWTVDDKVGCIAGLTRASALDTRVLPWLLSTKVVEEHPREFLYYTRKAVRMWQQEYPEMHNFVDAKYAKSIKWIRWMGFIVDPPEMINGEQFLRFHWER